MSTVALPKADGTIERYVLSGTPTERPQAPPVFNRIAYAAAHVVSDPLRDTQPWEAPAIDWEATLAFRHHLWSLGFRIAEAMDTAQRGMGLNWAGAQELIRRSLAEARTVPGADLACAEAFGLGPGERRLVPTGIAVEIPPGFYGRVAPRSGLAVRHGIDVMAGVIDADYRGEILVLLINLGSEPVRFSPGDRIAQLIIEHAAPAEYSWADELGQTERDAGGFGSTGDAQKIS